MVRITTKKRLVVVCTIQEQKLGMFRPQKLGTFIKLTTKETPFAVEGFPEFALEFSRLKR